MNLRNSVFGKDNLNFQKDAYPVGSCWSSWKIFEHSLNEKCFVGNLYTFFIAVIKLCILIVIIFKKFNIKRIELFLILALFLMSRKYTSGFKIKEDASNGINLRKVLSSSTNGVNACF